MENRTKNIKLLLLLSESLDKKESVFKMKMFNKILARIKFENSQLAQLQETELEAKDIIHYICKYYRVSIDDVMSKDRHRKFTLPRQIICTLLMDNTNLSLLDIGLLINRDHATVLHSHKVIDTFYEVDKIFKVQFDKILSESGFLYKTYYAKR